MSVSSTYDVVLVTYNSAACLPECLSAVDGFFKDRDCHIIVVDNASNDESVAEAIRVAPDATIIRNDTNLGFGRAVNQAILMGLSDWVVLVNPDVSAIKGSVEEFEFIATEDSIAAIATRMSDAHGVLARTCHSVPTPFTMLSEALALHERFPRWRRTQEYRMLDWDMTSARDVEDACGGFLALRRSAIETVGLFDERFFLYFEESDWLLRARQMGWRVSFTPAIQATHASGASTDESGEALSVYYLQSEYSYLNKHFGGVWEWIMRLSFVALDTARWSLGLLGAERRDKSREAARRVLVHLTPRSRCD